MRALQPPPNENIKVSFINKIVCAASIRVAIFHNYVPENPTSTLSMVRGRAKNSHTLRVQRRVECVCADLFDCSSISLSHIPAELHAVLSAMVQMERDKSLPAASILLNLIWLYHSLEKRQASLAHNENGSAAAENRNQFNTRLVAVDVLRRKVPFQLREICSVLIKFKFCAHKATYYPFKCAAWKKAEHE